MARARRLLVGVFDVHGADRTGRSVGFRKMTQASKNTAKRCVATVMAILPLAGKKFAYFSLACAVGREKGAGKAPCLGPTFAEPRRRSAPAVTVTGAFRINRYLCSRNRPGDIGGE